AALVSVLAVTAGMGWWRATRSAPPNPVVRLSAKLQPNASISRFVIGDQVAISPDGTLIAVTLFHTDGKYRRAARKLDQRKFMPLSGTDGAGTQFFSPDGQWLAFFADGRLKKVAVQGGSPISLCDAPGPMGASWGDDDNIIAALNGGSGLYR